MQIQQKEKKRAKYRISFIFLFIFASFAACFTLYMKEDFSAAEAVIKNQTEEITDMAVSEVSEDSVKKIINPVQLSDKADSLYFRSAAAVGGSRIKCLSDYGILSENNIFIDDGFSSRSAGTDGEGNPLEYDRLEAFLRDGGFDSVYFMTGMNDLGSDEDGMFDGLDGIVDNLVTENPDVKIYFVSLLPVTASYEKDNITNINIDTYNSAFLRFANRKNVYYLDLNTAFVGNDGKMPESMTEADGFILTKDTCAAIGDYLLTHIGV